MTLHILYDDTALVPPHLHGLIGVERFGSLMFRRRSRTDAIRKAAREAGATFHHVREPDDLGPVVERAMSAGDDELFLWCAAHLVPVDPHETLVTFLRQAAHSPAPLHLPLPSGRRGWHLMPPRLLTSYLASRSTDPAAFLDQHHEVFVEVRDRLHLIDTRDERALMDFLAGQFDARHFNAIEYDNFVVTKRSRDRAKLRREFNFYQHVPPRMQMFLVQPFDFEDNGTLASYRMERLSIPDMALQWVHGAFEATDFERFLSRVFFFLSTRPTRPAPAATLAGVRRALYVDKVITRTNTLRQTAEFAALEPLVQSACGGLDVLVRRYVDLYDQMESRFPQMDLAIGHGDPCFSNILYSKSSQFLKLIDPRGADSAEALFTDPYYDVAKLSHSILGHYDFINLGKFDIGVDDRLSLALTLADPPDTWAGPMFRTALRAAGFDPLITRLCEASLFISMTPLHIDRPLKVLGFIINASKILDDVSSGKEGGA